MHQHLSDLHCLLTCERDRQRAAWHHVSPFRPIELTHARREAHDTQVYT